MALARVNVSSGGGSKTPKLLSVPLCTGTLTYSGSAQSPTWSGYDATQLTIGGTTSATNAGTYTATFTLKSGYAWTDGTVSPKSVSWTIGKAAVTLSASISASVPYNSTGTITVTGNTGGGTLTVTSSNTNAVTIQSKTTSSVTVKAVSGSSSATITISVAETTNYLSASTTCRVSTAKATPTLTLSKTAATVTYGTFTTFTVSTNSDGALSVSSSASTYATASINENTVTVSCQNYRTGTTTITVTVAATDNYAKATATFTMTAAKATGTLTLSKTSDTVIVENATTFPVTASGDGALSVASSNTSVATASISGTTVTVTGKSAGTATITVSQAASTNYTAATATYTSTVANKTTATLTLSKTSDTVVYGNTTTFTVTTSSDGALSVTSSNTAVATATISGKTVTVTSVKAGSATITVSQAATTTYTAGTATCAITVSKATPTLALDIPNNKLTLKPGNTMTFAVTTPSDGALSAVSSNTSIATATISDNTVTVTSVATGTATLTISQAATDNYNAASMTSSVKCKEPVAITDSWATISTRSKNGTAGDYYDVGDYKEITLNGNIGDCLTLENEKLRVFILHINCPMDGVAENNIIWGGFKNADGTDIALCDTAYDPIKTKRDGTICFNMNHRGQTDDDTANGYYGTNYGGWKGCDLRYDILGATSTPPSEYNQLKSTSNVGYDATAATLTNPKADTLLAALPSDFRNVLRLWSRWVGTTTVNSTPTLDAVTLLAEFEVVGGHSWSSPRDIPHQTQMEYYRLGNSIKKYNPSDTSSMVPWWLASASTGSKERFCRIPTSSGYGNSTTAASTYVLGVAPAFKT